MLCEAGHASRLAEASCRCNMEQQYKLHHLLHHLLQQLFAKTPASTGTATGLTQVRMMYLLEIRMTLDTVMPVIANLHRNSD